jgi:thiamine biosynthesis lipoprotein
MKKRSVVNILIILAILGIGIYRYRTRHFTESSTRILMGTIVEVSLTSKMTNTADILDKTFEVMSEYDKKFSYYNPEGTLWTINNANKRVSDIDSEFYELLKIAGQYHEKTDGMYDVTIGALSDLWSGGRTYPPPADSVSAALTLTGFEKLSFTENKLSKPIGMKINFGSIAKGYIVDRCVEYALANGVEYGMINAGGDIRIFGEHKRTNNIGIRHPRSPDTLIDVLQVTEGAVVTSGDYERYFEYEGKKYHHIISPKDGYPVDYIVSVTILAPTATQADVLATSVFLMHPDEGIELIKSIKGAEGILFYYDGDELISLKTTGIRDYLKD